MQESTELKTHTHPIQSTYTTDSMRKVRDEESGKIEVKRWVEERQVVVSITTVDKSVFHKGARIA